MVDKLKRAIVGYFDEVGNFNRNIKLSLLATVLGGVAQGIFNVVFNLYILSMGITEDVLGGILSAGPFAHAIASIPLGFLSELVGYKEIFVGLYAVAGIASVVQAGTANVALISAAAFVSGFVLTGNFVVRMPFLAANANDDGRAHVFSVDSLLFGFSAAFGALIAGYVPEFLTFLSPDLTLRYRYTLYLAAVLTFLGVIPSLMLCKSAPRERKKISLYPYLWGMDGFTIKTAVIELFIGLFIGLVGPFMNLYFVYRLGTTREFYGTIEALALAPVMIATALVPVFVKRLGALRASITVRALVPLATFVMALTTAPWLGTTSYWVYSAALRMSQSMWFVFVMDTASEKSKVAISAWLEITFWLGMGVASWLTGGFLADANYTLPFLLSSAASVMTGVLTYALVGRKQAVEQSSST